MEKRRPCWNEEVELKLNTPEMRALQWKPGKKKIEHFYYNTPFRRLQIDKVGLTSEKIKTWEDFLQNSCIRQRGLSHIF